MKIAPLYHALKMEAWAEPTIVHTGQHYDANMSDSFFEDLDLPNPDIHLGIGSGTHAEQTGQVMIAYERILDSQRPDLVIVVGDVNSTVAATLAAAKLGIKVAHLEAGLRSYDRRMPEELNRLVTDALADILWTPSRDANQNLRKEGVSFNKIQFVGNIMIDSFEMLKPRIARQNTYRAMQLNPHEYAVVTIHRPSNVDTPDCLENICKTLSQISQTLPIVFPVHPRTKNKLRESGLIALIDSCARILTPDPMNYIRFMSLVMNAKLVITDSGGIQEETSYLGIPCLTLRENTERPVTITQGTNQLCRIDELVSKTMSTLKINDRQPANIEFWDGKTARRIVASLEDMAK
jgi:UDP-N-acetylglucosamine 2-epimerase (non-hydrolysing)